MYLTIELSETKNIEKNEISKKINSILSAELKNFDLRQLDVKDNFFQATYIIAIDDVTMLENSIVKLNKSFPKISINYIDQNQVPSI